MKFPKISIVTPNYNMGEYIENTILSVISQNYPNLEYIIIDGGSTDNSIDIIKKYEKKLAFWTSKPDNGMYDAIQSGFKRTTGEILAWINSDDQYHPGAFSIVSELFSNFQEINWLTAIPTAIDEKGRTIYTGISRNWAKYDFYISDYKWIQQESTFWRRSLWEKAGSKLDLNLKYAADLELWLRFFRFEKLYSVRSLIGGFRWKNENQKTVDHLDDYIREAEYAINAEKISSEDKAIIMKYHRIENLNNIFKKLKIFRTDWALRFKMRHFGYPPEICYSRDKQEFLLNK
jgi:glycosyltransferase involved in cell wall biosynthesis